MGHSCYSGPGRNSKARAGSNSCSHVLSFRIIDLGIDESYRSNLGIMTVGDGDAKTTRRQTQNPNSLCHRLARRATRMRERRHSRRRRRTSPRNRSRAGPRWRSPPPSRPPSGTPRSGPIGGSPRLTGDSAGRTHRQYVNVLSLLGPSLRVHSARSFVQSVALSDLFVRRLRTNNHALLALARFLSLSLFLHYNRL